MQSKIATAAAADYPCLRRLRHRRLLAYLRNHGLHASFHSVIQELGLHQRTISAAHLRRLVAGGRWSDALGHLRRCLPLPPGDVEARALATLLAALGSLASIAAADLSHLAVSAELRRRNVNFLASICRGSARLSSIVGAMLSSPLHRASLDWEQVKQQASSIVHDLALESPELSRREVLRLPAPGGPRGDVLLPVFRPSVRPRQHVRKQARRPTASAIAKLCLGLNNKKINKKRSLSSSSSGPSPVLDNKVLDRATDLIDKCLKAGKRPELHQGHPLQSTRVQGLNKEESACILYVENHCRLNPNTVLVDVGGVRLQGQYLKSLTIDKTHNCREKFIRTTVMNAYIKIISRRRASCVLSKRFLVYNSLWAQDIASLVNGAVSRMQIIRLLYQAKFLTESDLVFLPMAVEKHIIVLVVNNKSKQFQVLDSERTYSHYQSQINDAIRGIKNLLDIARSRGLHEVPDVTNWPVNQVYDIPRQEDGCSCTLFALKYIELWDGERLSRSFSQSDIDTFRVQVLVELLLSELNVVYDVKSELRRLLDAAR